LSLISRILLIVFTIYIYQKVWFLKWAPPEKVLHS